MSKTRRTFSPEYRLAILKECEREGQTVTCRKYNLSHTLVLAWKKKYLSKGLEGLKLAYKRVDPEHRPFPKYLKWIVLIAQTSINL
jgi:transposase-like protein